MQDRLWSYVNIRSDNQCWEWTGACSQSGYGQFHVCYERDKKVQMNSHRMSWEFANGEIPEDKWVLHHCDNRKCVNPNHLYLGSRYDNYNDMQKRGRARNASWPYTKGLEERINDLLSCGIGKKAISRYLGASINTVRKAIRANQNS